MSLYSMPWVAPGASPPSYLLQSLSEPELRLNHLTRMMLFRISGQEDPFFFYQWPTRPKALFSALSSLPFSSSIDVSTHSGR